MIIGMQWPLPPRKEDTMVHGYKEAYAEQALDSRAAVLHPATLSFFSSAPASTARDRSLNALLRAAVLRVFLRHLQASH